MKPLTHRIALLGAVATLGVATPALASHGGDDGPGDDSTTTTATTTPTTATAPAGTTAPSSSRAAVAAAKAAVDERTTLVRVRAQGSGRVAWRVRLRGSRLRYEVRLDADLDVVRIQRERIHRNDDGAGHDVGDDHGGDDRS